MQHFEPLSPGNFYHIYNHGVGNRNLFQKPDNYEYFLDKYDEYISPVADTYAWVLMPNHFHLLIRVDDEAEVVISTPDRVLNPVRGNIPSQQFSKLFNSYAQAFNKRFGYRGALFERPFKRKLIDNETHFKNVVLYIHNNPAHHGFCSHPMEYPWSSYLTCVSIKPTKLRRDAVMGWFDGEANFRHLHNRIIDLENIEKWLEL